MFCAATGVKINTEEMNLAAERINDIERAFAVREGMTRKDDHLRGKIINEPTQTGPYKGEILDPEKFESMLDEYYQIRGWDTQTGALPERNWKK